MVSNSARRRARRRGTVLSAVATSGVVAAMPVYSADPHTATDQLKTDTPIDTNGIASGGSIPPSNVRTIGDALNDKSISWAYYGGAYNAAVNLANG